MSPDDWRFIRGMLAWDQAGCFLFAVVAALVAGVVYLLG